jgi:hypothetical protein
MTARGDEGKVDKAIEIIRAAVIGMIITVGAYSITNFVVPTILERTTGGETEEMGVCCAYTPPDGNTFSTFYPRETDVNVCVVECPSNINPANCEAGTANVMNTDCSGAY